MAYPPPSSRSRSDRISGLTDDVLGHILSFLPTQEAARAAVLSRRWRHVFGSVHTISFEETEGEREQDWFTYYVQASERKSCSDALLDGLGAALLCRRRCPGHAVPLRSLRFAFDHWHRWDKVAVDQWLAYVMMPPLRNNCSHPGLHLDLRFHIRSICTGSYNEAGSDSDKEEEQEKRNGSCYCRLKLPEVVRINLPLLETLRLTGLRDSGRSIQRLISSCPRLADVTLEALCKLKRVSLLDKRLRRVALRCCHNLRSVHIDASTELASLEYIGQAPVKSLLTLHGSPAIIHSCSVEFCRPLDDPAEFTGFTRFLEEISDTKHLHLHNQSLRDGFFAAGFPLFSCLKRLTLQACIHSRRSVFAVGRILEQTPSLEVLSLVMSESRESTETQRHCSSRMRKVPDEIMIPRKLSFSIPCLRHRLREIRMEDYDGSRPHRKLAKCLVRNALVLEKLHVVFALAVGLTLGSEEKLKAQMGRWEAKRPIQKRFSFNYDY
ncbi:hypothetical protein VPH35_031852 [Triticum aestivum]